MSVLVTASSGQWRHAPPEGGHDQRDVACSPRAGRLVLPACSPPLVAPLTLSVMFIPVLGRVQRCPRGRARCCTGGDWAVALMVAAIATVLLPGGRPGPSDKNS